MPLKCCYDPNLLKPSKGVIGLLKEIPYALVDQRAAKLQSLKVCSVLCPEFEPWPPRAQRFTMQLAKT